MRFKAAVFWGGVSISVSQQTIVFGSGMEDYTDTQYSLDEKHNNSRHLRSGLRSKENLSHSLKGSVSRIVDYEVSTERVLPEESGLEKKGSGVILSIDREDTEVSINFL